MTIPAIAQSTAPETGNGGPVLQKRTRSTPVILVFIVLVAAINKSLLPRLDRSNDQQR
jgi:hypothetical protein